MTYPKLYDATSSLESTSYVTHPWWHSRHTYWARGLTTGNRCLLPNFPKCISHAVCYAMLESLKFRIEKCTDTNRLYFYPKMKCLNLCVLTNTTVTTYISVTYNGVPTQNFREVLNVTQKNKVTKSKKRHSFWEIPQCYEHATQSAIRWKS